MNPYVGKICPYCKSEIKEDDDIVICSKCEMPHHKDCWVENQGCTTFGCDGTIQSIPGSQSVVFEPSDIDDFDIDLFGEDVDFSANYCPKCGSVHRQEDRFCGHCGYDFSAVKNIMISSSIKQNEVSTGNAYDAISEVMIQSNTKPVNESVIENVNCSNLTYTSELKNHTFDEYVEKNTGYYSERKMAKDSGRSAGFNWSAFFFDGLWFAYRKMYGAAIIVAILSAVTAIFGSFSRLATFGIKLYIGFNANRIYIEKIAEYQNDETRLTGEYKDQFFRKHKGASVGGAILLLVGIYVSAFVLALMLEYL